MFRLGEAHRRDVGAWVARRRRLVDLDHFAKLLHEGPQPKTRDPAEALVAIANHFDELRHDNRCAHTTRCYDASPASLVGGQHSRRLDTPFTSLLCCWRASPWLAGPPARGSGGTWLLRA